MAFVSCDKQISSFATAIGSASVTDKQAIVAALSVNKDIAYVESTNFKVLTPEYRPNSSILPRGTLIKFDASGDTSVNAAFGTWEDRGTFKFLKTGNYYVTFEASIQAQVDPNQKFDGHYMDCGAYFRIGGKEWNANNCKIDCGLTAMKYQNGSAHGSITTPVSAGQTLQLFGWAVRTDKTPNTVAIGAPGGWRWGVQITQV